VTVTIAGSATLITGSTARAKTIAAIMRGSRINRTKLVISRYSTRHKWKHFAAISDTYLHERDNHVLQTKHHDIHIRIHHSMCHSYGKCIFTDHAKGFQRHS
jgi:hypothetical protein